MDLPVKQHNALAHTSDLEIIYLSYTQKQLVQTRGGDIRVLEI